MHKSHTAAPKSSTCQSIPFVVGKSISKSHNLGITIQQTKSLLNSQLNKKQKQKPQPKTLPRHVLETNSSSTIASNHRRNSNNVCPVIKYSKAKIDNSVNRQEKGTTEVRMDNKQSIDEIWADYMYEIESKNVIPLRCTCFPQSIKSQKQKQNGLINERITSKNERIASKTRINSPSTILLEAQKMVKECRRVCASNENDIIKDNMSTDQTSKKKLSKLNRLSKYMRQIKEIQEHLKG